MKELQKKLRENESILWQSGPKAFPLLEGRFKNKILGEWIVTLILAAWFLYIEQGNPNFGTGMKILVLVVAVVVMVSPVVEKYNLKRQKYYLTDQRAIVLTADNSLYYMNYDQIDDAIVIHDVADSTCIAMGSAILDNVRKQLRWQACHPKIDLQEADKRGEALGLVFYVPEGAEQALKLMRGAGVTMVV